MTQPAKTVPCRTQGYDRRGSAFILGTTMLWLLPGFWAMIAIGSVAQDQRRVDLEVWAGKAFVPEET